MLVSENLGRDALRLIVWYPVRWLILLMPVSWGLAFFRIMGDIHYRLSKGKRGLIIDNLRSVLGDRSDVQGISTSCRKYFRNHYVNQLQIFLFPRFDRDNIERVHTFEGLKRLDAALRCGKGCILVHPHFGPAQMPLCALGILGYPMMQLGLPTEEGLSFIGRKVAFRLRVKYEGKIPARIVSADAFLRPVLTWLKNNGVLMVTGEGAGGRKLIGKFIPVEFLGKPMLFPVGAATLALKTGSPILPMFTTIEKDNTYKTIIHEPIRGLNNPREQAVSATTREFVRLMEDYVYRFPCLWHFWDELNHRLLIGETIAKHP
jgi:lauroyl/myristoyl acyltransferase